MAQYSQKTSLTSETLAEFQVHKIKRGFLAKYQKKIFGTRSKGDFGKDIFHFRCGCQDTGISQCALVRQDRGERHMLDQARRLIS